MKIPPFLQPNDTLIAIAPSGTLREKELEKFEQGLEIWRNRGYKIELEANYGSEFGYLAGNDEIRRQALENAWINPQYKAILCVRGGYGGARLLEKWQWQKIDSPKRMFEKFSTPPVIPPSPPSKGGNLRKVGEKVPLSKGDLGGSNTNQTTPKWLIGFSDITSLLWSLYNEGITALHAPVLTTIAQEPEWSLNRLFSYLEGKPLETLKGKGWGRGKVKGKLLPANLTVATHLLGTPICPNFNNVILALEDVQEAPYRLDRMLTQWRLIGIFEQIKGIALGRFSGCEAPANIPSWTVEEMLKDRLQDLNLPIVSELPFGHDGVNACLPVGVNVELDSNQGSLSFL